jgi:hypothetical protein
MENKELPKIYIVKNNEIVLQRLEHQAAQTGRCYYQWSGVYKIISSTEPVTREHVDVLETIGVFGCGQMINAKLEGTDLIRYFGAADSGD